MKISLIQVPWDSGYYNKRMGKGPIHLIEQGLVDYLEAGGNTIQLNTVGLEDDFLVEAGAARDLNVSLAKTVKRVRKEDYFPVIFAGNCNTAIGTITGLESGKLGVIWFDAHADFNTPDTTRSGFFDGMALSVLTGNSWKQLRESIPGFAPIKEKNVILIGTRQIDPEEHRLLDASLISLISADDIRDHRKEALSESLTVLSKCCNEVYLHFDLDVLDPKQLLTNQFSVLNGLRPQEVKRIAMEICNQIKVSAISFTSYDPICDTENKGHEIVKMILDTILPHVE